MLDYQISILYRKNLSKHIQNKKVHLIFQQFHLKSFFSLEKWDVVATSWFIDTTHNIFEYAEVIFNTLKPGGIWVNTGPLAYTANSEAYYNFTKKDYSIELAWDEILYGLEKMGFKLEQIK